MSDLLTVILLGIVEGLTEFIPVSSTGHLVLAGELLGFKDGSGGAFDVVIQLGAILAVIVLYWRRFWDVALGLFKLEQGPVVFTRNILLGFLPSAVIGALAYKAIKAMLETPQIVAWALILGGVAILVIERVAKDSHTDSVEAMGWKTAFAIGVVQCLSMIPGVSRSGATIMGARAMGVARKTAAEFSFFVAIPTMMGATALALYKEGAALAAHDISNIAIGFVVSFVVALGVIKAFLAIVTRYGFAPFAWYRIVAGTIALIWLNRLG
ncbi:MAG: undecaprenyl-diphosphate phosphatase [Chakrabartia sp.]